MVGAVLLVWIGIQLMVDEGGEDDQGSRQPAWRDQDDPARRSGDESGQRAGGCRRGRGRAARGPAAAGDDRARAVHSTVIFGSGVVLKLMERFPVIVTLGAMLLGWIAGEMLAKEEVVATYTHDSTLGSLDALLSAARCWCWRSASSRRTAPRRLSRIRPPKPFRGRPETTRRSTQQLMLVTAAALCASAHRAAGKGRLVCFHAGLFAHSS